MRNTTSKLGPALHNKHLNEFMLKLKRSGYTSQFRAKVVRKAKAAYEKQVDCDKKGIKPLYRTRERILQDKLTNPKSKSKWWAKYNSKTEFNTVMFVPPTPGGKLAAQLREREKSLALNSKTKMRIKFIETGGIKIKNILSKKDPFPTQVCQSKLCPLCKDTMYSVRGKLEDYRIPCDTPSVGYRIVCLSCAENGIKASYEGETGRPCKVRFKEHLTDIRKGKESSPLVKHQNLKHPNEPEKFHFSITSKFVDPLTRQANEGVRIARFPKDHLILNSKSEFNHPPTNRITVRRNIQSNGHKS